MIVLIVVAVLCLIVPSLVWGFFLLSFRLRSLETTGTIIDYHTSRGIYGDISAPVVEFRLPDGRTITFTEKTHTSGTIFDLLSDLFSRFVLKKDTNSVKVLYDPNDPQKARVNTFTYLYFIPTLLFVIGLGLILFTIPAFREFLIPIIDYIERLAKYL